MSELCKCGACGNCYERALQEKHRFKSPDTFTPEEVEETIQKLLDWCGGELDDTPEGWERCAKFVLSEISKAREEGRLTAIHNQPLNEQVEEIAREKYWMLMGVVGQNFNFKCKSFSEQQEEEKKLAKFVLSHIDEAVKDCKRHEEELRMLVKCKLEEKLQSERERADGLEVALEFYADSDNLGRVKSRTAQEALEKYGRK